MDDCVAVNRRIGLLLDAEDPIANPYRLEVSSPGLTRRIKTPWEFEHFSGRKVKVQTSSGETVKGVIKGLEGDSVILLVEGSEIAFGLDEIARPI
jgi:ribosome maturation factor RimP